MGTGMMGIRRNYAGQGSGSKIVYSDRRAAAAASVYG